MDQPPEIDPPKKSTSWHNTITDYMSGRIRHIRASGNEWYRVHRSGGRNGGGDWNPWLVLICAAGAIWLVCMVVSWVIAIVQAVVSAVVAFLSVAVPVVAAVFGLGFLIRIFRAK